MRDLTTAMTAELSAGRVRPIYLAEIEFTSGTSYMWTGIGTISWNGHNWLGLGALATVSAIQETNEIAAENITLTLDGISIDLIGEALDECRQQYEVQVYLGFMTDDGSIVVDPVLCFDGHMDVPTVAEGADTASISITAENPLVDLQRASARRYTDQDQKLDYSTDKGFEYVPAVQSFNGTWGKAGGGSASKSGSVTPVTRPQPTRGGRYGL
ncbi:MAG: hypothetical protein ACRD3W_23180 [Terriglobales bacterium]